MHFNGAFRQNNPRIHNKVRSTKIRGTRSAALKQHLARSRRRATIGPMDHDRTSPSPDPFGLREGEVAVELPAGFDASLYFIGRIRTPWTRREDCPKNGRDTEAVCTIAPDPPALQALRGPG